MAVGLTSNEAVGDDAVKLWIEAESYASQKGSSAASYSMPNASGGAIVDSGWGGRPGDYLRYKINLPRKLPKAYVTLKYARAMPGDAGVELVPSFV